MLQIILNYAAAFLENHSSNASAPPICPPLIKICGNVEAMVKNSSLLKNTQVKIYPTPTSSYREIGLVWRVGSARVEEFKLLGEFIFEHYNLK